MHSAHRLAFWSALLLLPVWAVVPHPAFAEDRPKPVTISLEPFGIPKAFFYGTFLHGCFHLHAAGTRLFWLDSSHIFVAFTTNAPCTFRSRSEPENLRTLVFDSTGAKIASHDWPLESDLALFAGPNQSIVVWKGSDLEFLDARLQTVETGELAEKPKGLWVTPGRRTIPLLSADGRNFEFYGVEPLRLLTTIAIDQSTEANAVEDWVPGDERVAGAHCGVNKSPYTCNKILVLTPDANFLSPDGAPWSYDESDKPVALHPVGFLDSRHLLILRQEKKLFHSPEAFIVRPDNAKTPLSSPGGQLNLHGIAGVAAGGNRFALEYCAEDEEGDCLGYKRFIVEEIDRKKALFEKNASSVFSRAQLSPDGKSIAVLDNDAVIIYPLPTPE
ncbi:MAG: hypothetical protein WAK33_15880 [Silvibacterium sp.]